MQVPMTVSLFLLIPSAYFLMWMIFIFSGVMGGEIPLKIWRMWVFDCGIHVIWFVIRLASVLAAAAKIGFASDNHSTRIDGCC
ncbi:MAG: hypothetical protein U0905_22750 [Pirellulales bacterium]